MVVRAPSRGVLLLAVVGLSGCGWRAIGPARTSDDFERKARTSAESALSAVETVRLVADTDAGGRSLGPYSSVTVSEQEDHLAAVRNGFASIQPPDADADALRVDVLAMIDDARDHVSTVRIALRRGSGGDEVRAAAAPLADDADALRAFVEAP